MTASVIGALRVNLSVDTAEFKRALTEAERLSKRFAGVLGSTMKTGALALATGAAAATAGLVALTKSSMDTISAQVDLANRVGASVAAIQTLQEAAKLSGASQESLAKTLGTLNDKLGEAARTGAGPAHEALQRLGLSARALSQMDADERIKALSDRMAELGYSTTQTGDTLKQLGVKQQEMRNLFIEGSAAIDETRENLKAWGVLLSDVDAAKVEQAGDAWDRIGAVLTGVGNQIAVRLAPLIQEIAQYIGDAAKEQGGFGAAIDKALSMGIHLYGGLLREIYDVRVSTDEMIGSFLDFFDMIAGAPPKLLANIFGGTAEDYGFKPINESFGKLRQNLELPPSDAQWNVWLDNIRKKSEEAAQAALKARPPAGGDGDNPMTEARLKAQAEFQEDLAKRLETLREALLTERETEMQDYAARLVDLKQFHQQRLITAQEYADLRVAVERDHAENLRRIDEEVARNNERAAERQRRAYFQIADDIGSALNSVFGENKAVAMAMAVINTAQAVTRTLAEYGATPIGLAAAAAAAVAGAAELATIASTSRSGGGGGRGRSSSVGGGAVAAPQAAAPAAAQQSQAINVTLQGDSFGRKQVENFVEHLKEYQRDGGTITLNLAA